MTLLHPPLTPLSLAGTPQVRQSYAQRRLWFLNQMAPEKAQHNIVVRLSLAGSLLNADSVASALLELSRRHGILRTHYRNTPIGQEQWIAASPDVVLNLVDFTHLTVDQQSHAIDDLLHQEQHTPFDLKNGPVLRALLVTLTANCQELIYAVHHIAFDGRSNEIFLNELMQIYAAQTQLTEGEPLPPVTLQYRDFADWEPSYITPALIETELAFWRHYLADTPTLLEFENRPRQIGALRSARHHFTVIPALIDRLKSAANARGETLFTTLMGLFSVWVHYLSGQERFLVGTDVHGRDLPVLADIMGFFINQLTIKCDLCDDPTLGQLLSRSRTLTSAALAHRQLPFDVLVSALSPQRQPDRMPLFQVKLNYQRYQFPIDKLGDACIVCTQVLQDMAGFDLVLDLTHGPTGIEACLEYDQQRFSTQEIERIAPLWLELITHCDALLDMPLSQVRQRLQQWESLGLQRQQELKNSTNRARLTSGARKRTTPTTL